MYKPVEHKTVDELLLDAYKAQVSTYVRLLEVKDAQVASLEERIKDLEMKLNRYKCDNTGLTAKEREEIAKLSKEIMDESEEESEWPEEVTLEIDFDSFKSNLKDVILNALGLDVDLLQRQINQLSAQVSEIKNTTTANSDVDLSKDLHDLSLPIIQWLRKNHNPHKAVIITVDHSKIVEDQIGIPFN